MFDKLSITFRAGGFRHARNVQNVKRTRTFQTDRLSFFDCEISCIVNISNITTVINNLQHEVRSTRTIGSLAKHLTTQRRARRSKFKHHVIAAAQSNIVSRVVERKLSLRHNTVCAYRMRVSQTVDLCERGHVTVFHLVFLASASVVRLPCQCCQLVYTQ